MLKKFTLVCLLFLAQASLVFAQCNIQYQPSLTEACVGQSITFTNFSDGVTGFSPAWTFDATASSATSTATSPVISYTTAGVKTIQLAYPGAGCGYVNKITVTINPLPTVSFTSTAPKCAGANVSFTNTGTGSGTNITYSWDFGPDATPAISTAENPSDIVVSTSGSKKITFTINNGNCSITDTASIAIKAVPVSNFTVDAPAACTGAPVSFENNGTLTGATYLWKFAPGASSANSNAQNPSGITYSSAGVKTDTLITTLTAGGCTATSYKTHIINPTPTASFTSNAPQCANAGIDFTNTSSTGDNFTYRWDFGANATNLTSTALNPQGVTYTSGGSKTVTLIVNGEGGCIATDTVSIPVYDLPMVQAGADSIICAGTSVQIGAAPVAGYLYAWSPVYTLSNGSIANPIATPTAPYTLYILGVTDSKTGCQNSDTAHITMLPPIQAFAGADRAICSYDSTQIGAALVTGQTYIWSPANGLSADSLPNPYAHPDSTTIYTVSVSAGGCAPVTAQVKVTVHPLPNIQIAGNAIDSITVGQSYKLLASGGVQYSWTPAATLNDAGIYNPVATPTTNTSYIVTGTDVYGCVSTDTVTINVLQPSFWLPKAFTPDLNENNILYVRGEGIEGFQFEVFNRYGERIFNTTNQNVGWNGTKQTSGEQMPQGAYVVYVRGTLSSGKSINESAIVNLIR